MSVLTDSLNRIMQWLEENRPDYAASFLPGLSDEEIQEKLTNVELELPEEIYELYHWRNGVEDGEDSKSIAYPSMAFMSLDEAIEYHQGIVEIDIFEHEDLPNIFELLDANQVDIYSDTHLFPFLRSNCDFCAVLLSKKKQKHSPIIDISHDLDLYFGYRSLTTMIQTLAKYFETGAYYLRENNFLDWDKEKMEPIFHKYNPGLSFMID
ncbi:PBS lyase HEAT-like repeat protein [Calothrix parasitica NIES-267]|uniref:PBS lyase HEAT-like repeat protein n=1 Tax=Calothrix parasitica NIES-267 TaxID=1973488 RepID=A0A1Z4M1T6_9CYAN|nr:PBS lyase HEAT-like repeat protein [Calothrix parasitica NIES-267]